MSDVDQPSICRQSQIPLQRLGGLALSLSQVEPWQGARRNRSHCEALAVVSKATVGVEKTWQSYAITAITMCTRHFVELPQQPWMKALFASWRKFSNTAS